MRLLIIEDAPDIATLLLLAFHMDGYAVDTAATAAQALELAAINDYDVAILDLGLPDQDGLEVCRQLRADHAGLLLIILTARAEVEQRVRGLDAGADDYMTKPFHYEELCARVRALLRRDMRTRAPLLQCGDLTLDPATHVVQRGPRRLRLTPKEFSILQYLMRRRGEIISQEELLEHVWNAEANPFSNTIRVHINTLRHKLGDTAMKPRYIETVIGVGYRLDDFAHLQPSLTETLSPTSYASSTKSHPVAQRRNAMDPRQLGDPLPNAPRLLIVDDAPDITQLLVVYFHQAGYNALAAYDGRTAIDLFRRTAPNLLILDLGLPDIDGLEVCRQIRLESAVPVLMLTKRGAAEDRIQGYAAGADAYLVKPFDVEEVQAVVQALLRRGGAPAA